MSLSKQEIYPKSSLVPPNKLSRDIFVIMSTKDIVERLQGVHFKGSKQFYPHHCFPPDSKTVDQKMMRRDPPPSHWPLLQNFLATQVNGSATETS